MLDVAIFGRFVQSNGPMGMAFLWRGCSLPTIPPVGRRSPPPVEDPVAQLVARSTRTDVLSVRVPPAELNISAFPTVLRDWVIKGLGMSSLVYATWHIKDPVPLIDKRRGLSPGGRFPPSFIHQVIIITGLNKLYNCMFSP